MTCALGIINNGTNATVAMVVAVSAAGSVTTTATATNDQGGSANASATTQITAAATRRWLRRLLRGRSRPASAPPAGSVTRTGANLLGQLVTGGQSTAYFFQYGRTSHYGQATGVQRTTTAGSVAAKITGLRYRTRYHDRLVAINTAGVSYGADRTFVTAPRIKAKTVGLFIRDARTKRRPYAYTLAGALTLARGTPKVAACSGNVTIEIINGSTRLVSHTVKVSRTCGFASAFTVNKKLSAPGTLRARASFGGNQTLYGTQSRTITLRYG